MYINQEEGKKKNEGRQVASQPSSLLGTLIAEGQKEKVEHNG